MLKKTVVLLLLAIIAVSSAYADWCYQESANVSTVCGGLDSGAYAITTTGLTFDQPEEFFDESWTTSTYFSGGSFGTHTNFSINYTKPSNVNTATIHYKVLSTNYSNTVPSDCLSSSTVEIVYKYTFFTFGSEFLEILCHNSTGWMNISQINSTIADNLYEEGINWSITTSSCSYSGSGNWIIQGSDNCNLTTNTDLFGNQLIFNGTGRAMVNASLYNWSKVTAKNGIHVTIQQGGTLK